MDERSMDPICPHCKEAVVPYYLRENHIPLCSKLAAAQAKLAEAEKEGDRWNQSFQAETLERDKVIREYENFRKQAALDIEAAYGAAAEAGHVARAQVAEQFAAIRSERDGLLGYKACHQSIRKILGIADKGDLGNHGDVSTLDRVEELTAAIGRAREFIKGVSEEGYGAAIQTVVRLKEEAYALLAALPPLPADAKGEK